MKLSRIHLAGFRGTREALTLDVPSGFLVLCGPNGSGKSTICDALEYSLTGTILRFSERHEKGERLDDYLWWKGLGDAQSHLVKTAFSDGNTEIQVCRRKQDGSDSIRDLNQLYDEESAPAEPLNYLARSAIIRDEFIGNLSLDLSETDRFQHVRATIGAIGFEDLRMKLKLALNILKENSDRIEQEHGQAHAIYTNLLAELSEFEARASQELDLGEIAAALDMNNVTLPTDLRELSQTCKEALRDSNLRSSKLTRLFSNATDYVAEYRQTLASEPDLSSVQESASELDDLHEAARTQRQLAEQQLRDRQVGRDNITALADLVQAGTHLGVQNGHCPLCGSLISPGDFEGHVQSLRDELDEENEKTSKLRAAYAKALEDEEQYRLQLDTVRIDLRRLESQRRQLETRWDEIMSLASELGIVTASAADELLEEVDYRLRAEQSRVSRLESAVASIEGSRPSQRFEEVRSEIKQRKNELHCMELSLSKLRKMRDSVKAAFDLVRRRSGEIVDESLASISPLLKELYARLNPHIDWPNVEYHLRGDVRRYLSLRVGDGLNPAFMFRSGQRRAAGMAFLLAVFLSRSWSRFQTLVLDDPIQHIDDYRALNLVEVLAAVRRAGFQIICTVEDAALADLLCRRLGSVGEGKGRRVTLRYVAHKGMEIAESKDIVAAPHRVLLSA